MTNLSHPEVIDISPKIIQAILKAIRFSRPLPNTALHNLSIVQAQIPLVVSETMQDYLLVDWLSHEIVNQYNQHRQIYQLPPVDQQCNYPALLINLDEDFTQNNEHLEAWSLLYHRYVRVDLRLSSTDVQNIAGQSDRNIRRRQRVGYTLLCHHILSLERTVLEHNPTHY